MNVANFIAWYTANFPDNTTGLITEAIMRSFGGNIKDSFINNVDDLQKKTTATGTNTYAVTGGIASYVDGFMIVIKVTNASSAASTLNVNAKGAKKMYKDATTQVDNGDLLANGIYLAIYDSALDSAAGGFYVIGFGGSGSGGTDDGSL